MNNPSKARAEASLREVENTVQGQANAKNRKNQPASKYEEDDEISDIRFDDHSNFEEEIIEDSGFNQRTEERFQDKLKKADKILLNAGTSEYDELEEVSQSNGTAQGNFKCVNLALNVKKIKLHEFDNTENEGEQSIKIVEDRLSNPSLKSGKSIPKSEYLMDKVSIFDRIAKKQTLQCELRRDKKSKSGMIEYLILLQETKEHIITVRKEGMWEYAIYIRERKGDEFAYTKIATLESTFLSNRFTLVKQGQKYSNATICYESNFLGLSGPRKMNIYLPKTEIPLKFLDECYGDLQFREKIDKCVNKQAKWNEKEKSYVLSFKGRAKESSIKNFVITDSLQSEDKFYLIFAKSGPEVYNLDIQYPFSLIQGLAVALTTFEHKLTCD